MNKIGKTLPQILQARVKDLEEIKQIKCICPGCLVDFSMCPDIALLMVFERCHYHAKISCRVPGRGDDKTFWACGFCNHKQNRKCGYYQGGYFVKTCSSTDG